MRRPTTVLLGGSGFLGRHVRLQLRERGMPFACLGRTELPGERFFEFDATHPEGFEELCDSLDPALVLDCAAMARAAQCEREPERAWRLNRDLPERIAFWCRRRGARFVHVSTDLVFAGDAPAGGYDERATPAPANLYGRTKAAGEARVLALGGDSLIVRLPLLYGDSGGREDGASDSLVAAVRRGERPGLFTDEWRTPLWVEDAARALCDLARTDERGIVHVPGPERLSRHELGIRVLEAFGLPADAVRGVLQAELFPAGDRARDVSLASTRDVLAFRPRRVRDALGYG